MTLVPSGRTAHGTSVSPILRFPPNSVRITCSAPCHREAAALLAKSLRSSGVSFSILAFPERHLWLFGAPSGISLAAMPVSLHNTGISGNKKYYMRVFTMTPVSSIQLHPLGHADVRRRQEHRGRLLVQAGNACARYQDKHLKNLQCKRVQCDEIWAFCYSKDKNVPSDKLGKFGFGSVWTWVAIDADTTLICSMVGNRDAQAAFAFIERS